MKFSLIGVLSSIFISSTSLCLEDITEFPFTHFKDLSDEVDLKKTGAFIEREGLYRNGEHLCTPEMHINEDKEDVSIQSLFDVEWFGTLSLQKKAETLFQIELQIVNEEE